MLFLVNDFMDIAQFESNSIVLNMTMVTNLTEIISECMDILQFKAEAKNIQLLFETLVNESQEVRIDSNRVKQIIINLISNAIKYT